MDQSLERFCFVLFPSSSSVELKKIVHLGDKLRCNSSVLYCSTDTSACVDYIAAAAAAGPGGERVRHKTKRKREEEEGGKEAQERAAEHLDGSFSMSAALAHTVCRRPTCEFKEALAYCGTDVGAIEDVYLFVFFFPPFLFVIESDDRRASLRNHTQRRRKTPSVRSRVFFRALLLCMHIIKDDQSKSRCRERRCAHIRKGIDRGPDFQLEICSSDGMKRGRRRRNG